MQWVLALLERKVVLVFRYGGCSVTSGCTLFVMFASCWGKDSAADCALLVASIAGIMSNSPLAYAAAVAAA
jgi:hypothetical protein